MPVAQCVYKFKTTIIQSQGRSCTEEPDAIASVWFAAGVNRRNPRLANSLCIEYRNQGSVDTTHFNSIIVTAHSLCIDTRDARDWKTSRVDSKEAGDERFTVPV